MVIGKHTHLQINYGWLVGAIVSHSKVSGSSLDEGILVFHLVPSGAEEVKPAMHDAAQSDFSVLTGQNNISNSPATPKCLHGLILPGNLYRSF